MEADTTGEAEPQAVRTELIERLRALEGPQSDQAEVVYKRALEALEEARIIRQQAIEDARLTRERELAALLESMRALRQAADSQVETVMRKAEIEAERVRDQAGIDARTTLDRARVEANGIQEEARAIRAAAERRAQEVDRLESEFNRLLTDVVERLGLTGKQPKGWRKHPR
ncbi:MAG TPA: hypothetical protein VJB57_20655 [Dehalococcoidia bacterium]|nr:hypothetical protein [Dehalococcoidia bacterium]